MSTEIVTAIDLLRSGRRSEAIDIYTKCRSSDKLDSSPILAMQVILFEGLRIFFEHERFTEALDRVNRALQLAISLNQFETVALAGAWKAHISFNSGNYEEMASSVTIATKAANTRCAAALARMTLTIADAFCSVENYKLGREWYDIARRIAVKTRDRLTIAAIAHNRSVITLSNCLFEKLCIGNSDEDARTYLLEIVSAESYEKYIGMMPILSPYQRWRARLDILDDKFSAASQVLENYLSISAQPSESKAYPLMLIDLAFCHSKLGITSNGDDQLERLDSVDFNQYAFDDRAIAFAMIANVHKANGNEAGRARFEGLCDSAIKSFRVETDSLLTQLGNLSPTLRLLRHTVADAIDGKQQE